MKRALLIILTVFTAKLSSAQTHFSDSYQHALTSAAKSNKLIFVSINPPSFGSLSNMKSGIYDPQVIGFLDKNFVNFSCLLTDTASMHKLQKFQIGNIFPCYLFIDGEGNLVYKASGSSPMASKYLDMAKGAMARNQSGNTITAYEKRYKTGKVDGKFLKDYITLKEEVGLYDNAKLADEYVEFLTVGDLKNYGTVLFLLEAGPYAYGKTFSLIYNSSKIADSIYRTEPAKLRSDINSRIMANTRAEAIVTKNREMAQRLANFTQNIWRKSNPRQGYVESQREMLWFYKGIKDTANYLSQAEYFYDQNYMKITADSAKKLLDKQRAYITKNGARGINSLVSIDTAKGKVVTTTRQMGVSSPVDPIASGLNAAAWEFYLTGTQNSGHLLKALLWSKRSISLSPDNYAFYDTYAHVLYRLSIFEDAEGSERTAIKLAKEHNLPPLELSKLEDELKKIKQRKI